MFDELPIVSIIFPTYNRKADLQLALESLQALTYAHDRYEIVVVDDGSTDNSDQVVHSVQEDFPGALVYLKQSRKGITAARNLGIHRARGDLLVFTDDDCTFEKDWLQKLISHFDSPKVGAVGGPDRGPLDAPFLARCVDYTTTSLVGTGGVRRKEGLSLARYYPRGCNMAVPRRVLEDVGTFDETLAAGEEIDLGHRIRQAGYQLKYAPEALVWHKRRGTIKGFLQQMFTRGYTRVELIRRHAQLLEPSYLLPPLMVTGFIILLSICFFVPSAQRLLVLLTSLYIIVLFLSGLHGARIINDRRSFLAVPVLLLLQHSMYGLGFISALCFRTRKIDS